MKKTILLLAMLLTISLSACSNQDLSPAPADEGTQPLPRWKRGFGLPMHTRRGFPFRPVRSHGQRSMRNMAIAVST